MAPRSRRRWWGRPEDSGLLSHVLGVDYPLGPRLDPADSRHVWVATDEGVFESNDGGSTWRAKNDGLCTTQCDTIAVGTSPYRGAITTQDNRCYQAGGADDFRIGCSTDWREAGVDYDPGDSGTVYLDTRNTQGPWPMRRLTLGPSGEPLSVQALHRRHRCAPEATRPSGRPGHRSNAAGLAARRHQRRSTTRVDGQGGHWTQVLNPGANETTARWSTRRRTSTTPPARPAEVRSGIPPQGAVSARGRECRAARCPCGP